MNTCASIAILESVKLGCDAALIRAIWKAESRADLETIYPPAFEMGRAYYSPPKLRHLKREAINHAAGFYGVEYIGRNRRTGEPVYYCNAGDTYAGTLCFMGGRLFVSTVGDIVESGRIQERGQ